jgi:hypothetical protein
MKMNREQVVEALKALPDDGELVITGEVWVKDRALKHYKVSPYGLAGDFDMNAYWVYFSELADEFDDGEEVEVREIE